MSRYIDADALKEYIGSVRAEFNFFDDDERPRYEAHSKAIYLLDLYISDAPSIEIIRCKECKWCLVDEGGCERIGMVLFADEIENHFCGYGKRREP